MPHCLSCTALPAYPASSNAFQDSSRNKRCWGSIQMASRGEILKNDGSNRSTESIKLPWLQYLFPEDSEITQSLALQRETRLTRSFPSLRFRQNSSSDSDSAKRPLMPMMAMGSTLMLRELLS